MVSSSGSLTKIVYETGSPKLNKDPLIGEVIVTAGAVFPTSITTLAFPVRPPGSVTVNVAVRTPFDEYVWLGFAAVDVLPSPKFHERLSAPPSGSNEPAEEKLTVIGAIPDVRLAAAFAVGARFPPGLYSIRYSAELASPPNEPVP